jgi:hypothetical protein
MRNPDTAAPLDSRFRGTDIHHLSSNRAKGFCIDINTMPTDITREAAIVDAEILRKMDISQRAAMMFELSDNLHQIIEAGVRYRNPHWDDQAVKREVMRLVLGEHLFREVIEKISGIKQMSGVHHTPFHCILERTE